MRAFLAVLAVLAFLSFPAFADCPECPECLDMVLPYYLVDGWEYNTLLAFTNLSDDDQFLRGKFFTESLDLPRVVEWQIRPFQTVTESLRDLIFEGGPGREEGWVEFTWLGGGPQWALRGDYIIVHGPDVALQGKLNDTHVRLGRYVFRFAYPEQPSFWEPTEFLIFAPDATGDEPFFPLIARGEDGQQWQLGIDVVGGLRPGKVGIYSVENLSPDRHGFGVIEITCPVRCQVWAIQRVKSGLDSSVEAHYIGED